LNPKGIKDWLTQNGHVRHSLESDVECERRHEPTRMDDDEEHSDRKHDDQDEDDMKFQRGNSEHKDP
jgi:hypothetical protein